MTRLAPFPWFTLLLRRFTAGRRYEPLDPILLEVRGELRQSLRGRLRDATIEAFMGDVRAVHAAEWRVLERLGDSIDDVDPVNVVLTNGALQDLEEIVATSSDPLVAARTLFGDCRVVASLQGTCPRVPFKIISDTLWRRCGEVLVFFRFGSEAVEILHMLESDSRYESLVLRE